MSAGLLDAPRALQVPQEAQAEQAAQAVQAALDAQEAQKAQNMLEAQDVQEAENAQEAQDASKALLLAAQDGDRDAWEQVVRENRGLIWSVAQRYRGRGVEMDDLYQLGCLGFLKAVQGFDAAYGTRFSTYAVPKIAGEIRRFLRDSGPVKLGRTMWEQAMGLRRVRDRLRQELGREPALSELSAEAGLPPEEIARLELSTDTPESLQQETAEGLPLEGLLGIDAPEDAMVERIALREAVDALPERERMAILLRYFRGMTQEQAGRVLGVSQVQVSRLERRGLDRLRRILAG